MQRVEKYNQDTSNTAVGGTGTTLSYTGHRQEVTVVKAGRDKALSLSYYVVTFIVT